MDTPPETTSLLDDDDAPETAVSRQNWLDLLAYILVGFGSFLLLSLLIDRLFAELTIGVTALLLLANVVCFSGTTYLLGIRRHKISWASLGIWPIRATFSWLIIGIVLALVLLPVRGLLGLLVQLLLEGNMDSLQTRSDLLMGGAFGFSWAGFLIMLVGAGILVPISEELFFRGLIHTWFWQATPRIWLRVLASSTIFALGHADAVGVVAASFVIGVVNALAYERTKSLFIPIVIHITTNGTAVILLYLSMWLLNAFPELNIAP